MSGLAVYAIPVPGAATIRSTTSLWSMKVQSRIRSAYPAMRKRIGVETL